MNREIVCVENTKQFLKGQVFESEEYYGVYNQIFDCWLQLNVCGCNIDIFDLDSFIFVK